MKIAYVALTMIPLFAKSNVGECGTTRATGITQRYLHQKAALRHFIEAGASLVSLAANPLETNFDQDGIAVIDDSGGVVERMNPFTLGAGTISFTPAAAGAYEVGISGGSFDSATAATAGPLLGMGDDDTRTVSLPFSFPFYGTTYHSIAVNSDGNLTFQGGDVSTSDRSVGRMNEGLPRIAPLFTDLNPSVAGASITVAVDSTHAVISWNGVPIYTTTGVGSRQSFQVRLYQDGSIVFAYAAVDLTGSTAVVGIGPGHLIYPPDPINLARASGFQSSGEIIDYFTDLDTVDITAVAQKFLRTHEDAYDYLVLYNGIHLYTNGGATVAYESTVRNAVQGFGLNPFDDGAVYGSPRRLQAFLDMGPMEQYPKDPHGLVMARAGTGDTGLAVLGHEAGHRFLAWTSVNDGYGTPVMLGRALVHWSFNFDSEASLVEGNRIRDDGAQVTPRFTTVATAEGYSPLDQYLFGFRTPAEVDPVFAAVNTDGPVNASPPHAGTTFNGQRLNIGIEDIIKVTGVRVPDSAVAQRKYRFAFVYLNHAGTPVAPDQFAQLALYRSLWVSYWAQITGNRSVAEIDLRKALSVTIWPNAEMQITDAGLPVTVSIAAPLDHDLTISVATPSGILMSQDPVTIPAGATSVTFTLVPSTQGIEVVTVQASDPDFEVVEARVRVN